MFIHLALASTFIKNCITLTHFIFLHNMVRKLQKKKKYISTAKVLCLRSYISTLNKLEKTKEIDMHINNRKDKKTTVK